MEFYKKYKYYLFFAVWIFVGFLYATQNYLFYKLEGFECGYWGTLADQGSNFLLWGLYSPLILIMRDKFPLHSDNRIKNIFLIHLPLMVVLSTFHIFFLGTMRWFAYASQGSNTYFLFLEKYTLGWIFFQMILYLTVILFGYLAEYYEKFRLKEESALYLEKLLLDSELKALKEQLHPHFLFNTLNTISMLIRGDAKQEAVKTVANLSELLRQMLEKRYTQWTTLEEEIKFIDKYLEIMSVRFQDKFSYHIHLDERLKKHSIPDLLLQPIVENCIKHGIGNITGNGEIEITAAPVNGSMRIKISDNGSGCEPGKISEGLGINNIKERLARLYHNNYSFDIKSGINKGTIVNFTLPVKQINSEENNDND